MIEMINKKTAPAIVDKDGKTPDEAPNRFRKGDGKKKGRPKGSTNKTPRAVALALQEAFDELGGVPSLVAFGQNNPQEFYKLWVKMLPQQVKTEVSFDANIVGLLQAGRQRLQYIRDGN